MKVNFKKLSPLAKLPHYGSIGAAGLDITATSKSYDEYGNVVYGTGLSGKLPDGHVGLLFPRSSNSKKDLLLSNAVGVWDEDYTGEIFFKFKPSGYFTKVYENDILSKALSFFSNEDLQEYQIGDRIGQLIILPYPKIEPEWADELPSTIRGDKGWGSTDN